ncbi:hypothetical protein [Streptococcus orisasini]|uniref:hypothetical protein n=1 Tax=Streptococcus orisasini TaxID=1080071 RepID=UPI000708C838|nr:hypothetical protein [Streptococcus orisasini]
MNTKDEQFQNLKEAIYQLGNLIIANVFNRENNDLVRQFERELCHLCYSYNLQISLIQIQQLSSFSQLLDQSKQFANYVSELIEQFYYDWLASYFD